MERALAADQRYSDNAWLQEQASQMESYGFYTLFASVYLESTRRANLRKLQKQLRTQGKEAATPMSPSPLVAAGKVDRATDTLFRVTLKDCSAITGLGKRCLLWLLAKRQCDRQSLMALYLQRSP